MPRNRIMKTRRISHCVKMSYEEGTEDEEYVVKSTIKNVNFSQLIYSGIIMLKLKYPG